MYSILDALTLGRNDPEGVAPGSDKGALVTGTLLGLDVDAKEAQVSVGDSLGVWVPALPAIYTQGAAVRCLRSPLDGGRVTACLGPLTEGDLIVAGVVDVIDSGSGELTVTALGEQYVLPYNPGTYVVGTPVHVMRDPQRFGAPVFVQGPQGNFAGAIPSTPGGGVSNPGQTTTRQAVIVPQWSGSWRSGFSRWDTWNTDRYGGRPTLWQGNGFGSTPMTGLATYGDQFANLNAVSFSRMRVNVYRGDTSSSSAKTPVLQPSPHGSKPAGAPTVSGATATGAALTPGALAVIDLPSGVFEAFRTGASKGLATVGTDYAGFLGTSRADGFAVTVDYQVVV